MSEVPKFDEATQVNIRNSRLYLANETQKELATFLSREETQAKLQSTVHTLTNMCWDKYAFNTVTSVILNLPSDVLQAPLPPDFQGARKAA